MTFFLGGGEKEKASHPIHYLYRVKQNFPDVKTEKARLILYDNQTNDTRIPLDLKLFHL